MPSMAVKTVFTRACGENGLDEDQFLSLCLDAGYICRTFREEDARRLFRQMGCTSNRSMTVEQIDTALDRIAAMRVGHLQKFTDVCARMVRDREFRRVKTELSLGGALADDLGEMRQQPQAAATPKLLSPVRARSSSRIMATGQRCSVSFADSAASPSNGLGKSASLTKLARLGVQDGRRAKPALPLKAFSQPKVLRGSGNNVIADTLYRSPWGGSANPDPDFFLTDHYSPGMAWKQRISKSESVPHLTTTQLLRNALRDAAA
eukprot:TRINITY_DN25810_c0_g1_i1.p1 TRINITY_DN25810_c0_g1~~TRINITY_DN25810_c0_g1_i1.p1  ORF type:complete len:297 (+),score=25.43 TRINITY_DN25810_c0_g1_i1:103-891(+)